MINLLRGARQRTRNPLRPVAERTIRPDVHLPHGPDHAALNPFIDEKSELSGCLK